ncbi:MAG: hypothetical protein EOP84_19040 [Verrucomicrobiaceae bacterium]|nr:MAG: hypothetical protein EOP84_19040 [Verrucomicrobiaceae bacterium]
MLQYLPVKEAFDGVLKLGVIGVIILVAIGSALIPILTVILPIIAGICAVLVPTVLIIWFVQSVMTALRARKERLARDPRRP